MNKIFKKTLCSALAITSAVASIGLFTACETSKPRVEIQLQFQNTKYTLDYTLYREVAPNTVAHFLALAENEYYNELCMHDYTAARMVGFDEYSTFYRCYSQIIGKTTDDSVDSLSPQLDLGN